MGISHEEKTRTVSQACRRMVLGAFLHDGTCKYIWDEIGFFVNGGASMKHKIL